MISNVTFQKTRFNSPRPIPVFFLRFVHLVLMLLLMVQKSDYYRVSYIHMHIYIHLYIYILWTECLGKPKTCIYFFISHHIIFVSQPAFRGCSRRCAKVQTEFSCVSDEFHGTDRAKEVWCLMKPTGDLRLHFLFATSTRNSIQSFHMIMIRDMFGGWSVFVFVSRYVTFFLPRERWK